jgi:2'-hydroxyisoflavone reductase
MKILIIGGTRFLGRHIVHKAIELGHEITLFNRGKSNPGLFPQIETVFGDRETELYKLSNRVWDVVIDTCGYLPNIVEISASWLMDKVNSYVYISSISVYEQTGKIGLSEQDEISQLRTDEPQLLSNETYGALKGLCEKVVQNYFPSRSLIIRPGLIVGPFDPTDRFTYWPWRVSRGGEVLVPGEPNKNIQIIDVRDLAGWILSLAAGDLFGIFNAVGLDNPVLFGDILEISRQISMSDAHWVWVNRSFLDQHQIQWWTQIPLWLPGEENNGMDQVSNQKAVAAGLTFRPLMDTIADTIKWANERPISHVFKAGLDPQLESKLLADWKIFQSRESS